MNIILVTIIIGIGATVVMDVWGFARKLLLGVAPPNYALVGRWIGHMKHGQFRHDAIATAKPVRGEHIIGWAAHYLIGIAFAALLIGIGGSAWVQQPSLWLALAVGITTVAAPFLLMQPGMGAGIAAAKTPRPASARIQSLITHTVFGFGLYATGQAIHFIY